MCFDLFLMGGDHCEQIEQNEQGQIDQHEGISRARPAAVSNLGLPQCEVKIDLLRQSSCYEEKEGFDVGRFVCLIESG